jgi:hypothetical protein
VTGANQEITADPLPTEGLFCKSGKQRKQSTQGKQCVLMHYYYPIIAVQDG